MKCPTPDPQGNHQTKEGRTSTKGPTPDFRSADASMTGPTDLGKRDATLADVRRALAPASSLEPLLKLADLTRVLNCQLRTVERLRSSGRLPKPDLFIGTGTRKSPRWKPATIRRWIDEGGTK